MGGRGGSSSGGGMKVAGSNLKAGQKVTVTTHAYGNIRGTISNMSPYGGVFHLKNVTGLQGKYKGQKIDTNRTAFSANRVVK